MRAGLADRQVVLERLVEDRGLGRDELEEQPRGRGRVVVGELDQRAAQPWVLALRAAGEVGAGRLPRLGDDARGALRRGDRLGAGRHTQCGRGRVEAGGEVGRGRLALRGLGRRGLRGRAAAEVGIGLRLELRDPVEQPAGLAARDVALGVRRRELVAQRRQLLVEGDGLGRALVALGLDVVERALRGVAGGGERGDLGARGGERGADGRRVGRRRLVGGAHGASRRRPRRRTRRGPRRRPPATPPAPAAAPRGRRARRRGRRSKPRARPRAPTRARRPRSWPPRSWSRRPRWPRRARPGGPRARPRAPPRRPRSPPHARPARPRSPPRARPGRPRSPPGARPRRRRGVVAFSRCGVRRGARGGGRSQRRVPLPARRGRLGARLLARQHEVGAHGLRRRQLLAGAVERLGERGPGAALAVELGLQRRAGHGLGPPGGLGHPGARARLGQLGRGGGARLALRGQLGVERAQPPLQLRDPAGGVGPHGLELGAHPPQLRADRREVGLPLLGGGARLGVRDPQHLQLRPRLGQRRLGRRGPRAHLGRVGRRPRPGERDLLRGLLGARDGVGQRRRPLRERRLELRGPCLLALRRGERDRVGRPEQLRLAPA